MTGIIGKLKCKLGYHDFKGIAEDLRFLPNVKIIKGGCSRCGEPHNFFIFMKSRKVVSTRNGIDRLLLGEYGVFPLEDEEEA